MGGLSDQVEAGSYTLPLPNVIDPVACQIHLLILLMEVYSMGGFVVMLSLHTTFGTADPPFRAKGH